MVWEGEASRAEFLVEAGLVAAEDAGDCVFGLGDADDGAEEDGGDDPEIERREGDAVCLDVDE